MCRSAATMRADGLLSVNRRLSLRWFEPSICHHQTRRSDPVRWAASHALRERSGITAPVPDVSIPGPVWPGQDAVRRGERLAALAALLSRVVEQWFSSRRGARQDHVLHLAGCDEPLQLGGPLGEHRSPTDSVHFADPAWQQPVGGERGPPHCEVHQQGVLGGQQPPSGSHGYLRAALPQASGEQ
jgi:hypothetical protein